MIDFMWGNYRNAVLYAIGLYNTVVPFPFTTE